MQVLCRRLLIWTCQACWLFLPCWIEQIDEVASRHPEFAAALTFQVDVTSRGLNRILNLIASRSIPTSYLNGFASSTWRSALQDSEKARIICAVMTYQGDALLPNQSWIKAITFWTNHGSVPHRNRSSNPDLVAASRSMIHILDQHDWSVLNFAVTHEEDRCY